MTRDLEQKAALEQAVERSRREFEAALDELRLTAERRTHIHYYVAQRPYTWILGAFAFGWLLGARAAKKRRE